MIKVILLRAPCQNVNMLLSMNDCIDSESGVTISYQFWITRLDMWRHQARDHSTRHRPLPTCWRSFGTKLDSLYLQPFSKYWPESVLGSQPWPFRVTTSSQGLRKPLFVSSRTSCCCSRQRTSCPELTDKSKHGNFCSICEFLGHFVSESVLYTCRLQQLQVGAANCRLQSQRNPVTSGRYQSRQFYRDLWKDASLGGLSTRRYSDHLQH